MKVVAVDAGKHATKAIAADGSKTLFRTKSTQLKDSFDIDASGNSNKVIYEEQVFILVRKIEKSFKLILRTDLRSWLLMVKTKISY